MPPIRSHGCGSPAATTLFDDNAEQSKKLLNQAIEGFTNSMLAMPDPNLIRENTLGRAYCERELGKFDHAEYDHAIADFKKIMEDGTGTQQYAAARQGLSTTYAKMGDAKMAAETLPVGPVGKGASGQFMLQLQTLFSAERATSNPAEKAKYHQQIVELMKTKENDKEGWALDVSAATHFPQNAIEEFGNSNDPFEKWLLAAVLLSRKDEAGAAKYYSEACDSGKYPKACRFAADIYQREKRFDLVQDMLTKIAQQGGGDASQATFLEYSLDHDRWEKSGRKDTALEDKWVKDANDYLQKAPGGEHAAELQVALAERLQRQGDLLGAADMYSKVKGDPEFTFTAKFKAAECYYKILVGAGAAAKDNKTAAKIDTDQLRKLAVADLNESIKMGHEAEAAAKTPAAKNAVREIRGEATYMLASILEEDPEHVDYAQVAPLLVGYESNYPMMSAKFQDVIEWRITALDHLGRYDEVNTDVAALVERSNGDIAKGDFIKGLGIDFWKAAQEAQGQHDEKAYKANAKVDRDRIQILRGHGRLGQNPGQKSDRYAVDLRPGVAGDRQHAGSGSNLRAGRESRPVVARCERRSRAQSASPEELEGRGQPVDHRREHRGRVRSAVVRGQVPTRRGLSRAGQQPGRMQQAGADSHRASNFGLGRDEGAGGTSSSARSASTTRATDAAMLKKIHHVGVVVPNLDEGLRFWRDTLGLHFTKSATIEEQGVRAALLKAGESEIELLEPLDPNNAVGKFLARRGGGLHHVCFETDDVARELEAARAKGIQLIDQKPRNGLAGMICFLHPKATRGVLVEYAQPPGGIGRQGHADLRIPMRQLRPLIRSVRPPRRRRRAMPALSRLKADARNVDVRGARQQWRRGGRGRLRDGNLRHVERRRLHRRRMLRWRLRLSLIAARANN